jgi:hypothetical protein
VLTPSPEVASATVLLSSEALCGRAIMRVCRARRLFAALLVVFSFAPAFLAAAVPAHAGAEQCFPETGRCVGGRFLEYWLANGGLAQQGYPLTGEFDEISATDDKSYRVQYFERARFELHPENRPPYDVLLGQVGREQFAARYPGGVRNTLPDAGPERRCFPETGFCVDDRFLRYWREHGGLAQQGFPISPLFLETNPTDGKDYATQYFERARFEYHPKYSAPNDVLLGLLGREQFRARYPDGPPVARDTFADPASGWPTVQGAAGGAGYADSGYRMAIAQQETYIAAVNRLLPAYGNVVVDLTVRKRGGPDDDVFGFGVVCRAQDERNFYLLAISGGGLYGIVKVRDGRITQLRVSNGIPSPQIRAGNAENRLVARCTGDTLALAVNGQLLVEVRDSEFTSGKVGLVVGAYGTPGADVLFDNLVIYAP